MALSPGRYRPPYLTLVPREPIEPVLIRRWTGPLWLAFGVAGGPLALAVSYAAMAILPAPACSAGGVAPLGVSGAQISWLLVCAACVLAALGAEIVSYRAVNEVASPDEESAPGRMGQRELWSMGGVIVSGVCLVAIIAIASASLLSGVTCP